MFRITVLGGIWSFATYRRCQLISSMISVAFRLLPDVLSHSRSRWGARLSSCASTASAFSFFATSTFWCSSAVCWPHRSHEQAASRMQCHLLTSHTQLYACLHCPLSPVRILCPQHELLHSTSPLAHLESASLGASPDTHPALCLFFFMCRSFGTAWAFSSAFVTAHAFCCGTRPAIVRAAL